uniref:Uncharacterized protein n=1 Tax=Romanomermis culicivorax TaxID=13658 RepID=A0A915JKU9_ROMCU
MEAGDEDGKEAESDSPRTFLIVALILAFLVIASVGFLWHLMHKRNLAQTVKTRKPEVTSKTLPKAKASMQSLSIISTDASPSFTTVKSKNGSKQVMVKVISPSQSQKSTVDKTNSMSDTLFSTTSSLPTKSKRTVKDSMSKK